MKRTKQVFQVYRDTLDRQMNQSIQDGTIDPSDVKMYRTIAHVTVTTIVATPFVVAGLAGYIMGRMSKR